MTPLPKNKITRAERGKRRRGNTPKLVKNAKVAKLKMILEPVVKTDEKTAKKQLAAKMATKRPKKTASKKKSK